MVSDTKTVPLPIASTGRHKSISDDDLCSTCVKCQYQAGEMSCCESNWPGHENADGYVIECASFNSSGVNSNVSDALPSMVDKLKALELEIQKIESNPRCVEGGQKAWNSGRATTLTKAAKAKIARLNMQIDKLLDETDPS